MRAHGPTTQALYAQLFESTAAYDIDLAGGFAQGFAVERAASAGRRTVRRRRPALRYMDYLVRDDVSRGLFIGGHAVLVNVPHAGRFALHKLAVSMRRAAGPASIKADKDRRQAEVLILALADRQPGALALAADAARAHHDRGLARDIAAGAKRISAAARAHVSGSQR